MNSPANETAEQWEHDELWDAQRYQVEKAMLCSAIEHYSGMEAGRALEAYLDRNNANWTILLEDENDG